MRKHWPAPPVGISVVLVCVTAAAGVPAVASADAEADPDGIEMRWKRQRRDLAIGVGVAAAASFAGMLTTFIPLSRCLRGIKCSGDEFPRDALIAGPIVFGLGALVTAGLAVAFVHHDRWHRPGMRLDDSRRARAAQRRLNAAVGLALSLGGVAIGSLTLGLTFAASTKCDYGQCAGTGVGAGIGLTLIPISLVGLTISATAYALHRRHKHDRERRHMQLQPSVGGLRLSF